MIYFLIIATIYLTITSVILLRNIVDFHGIKVEDSPIIHKKSISFCIPARNEETSIRKCVESVIHQEYSNIEILVLNDHSIDKTGDILADIQSKYPDSKFSIISGEPKPDAWLGKNWACHQLSIKATGDIIVFLDADTWIDPHLANSINNKFNSKDIDVITIWPEQELGTFWEKVIIPQIYYVVFTLLPVRYSQNDPKWMPKKIRPMFKSYFAAACGQFIAFKKEVYHSLGGHSCVRNKVVEDVELARLIRRNDYKIRLFRGQNAVYCRMYTTHDEILKGFRKNFLAGFGNNLLLFVFAGFLHFITFLLPVITFIIALTSNNYTLAIFSCVIIIWPWFLRFYIDYMNNWNLRYSFFHQCGVAWFQILSIIVLLDMLLKRKVSWKGRNIS